MKPDKYGQPYEQKLYRIKWEAKSEDPEKRCEKCHYYELDFKRSRKGSPRCLKHNSRTLIRATCPDWEKKRAW